LVKKACPKDTK